jgi:protein-tyrosine phosphatase
LYLSTVEADGLSRDTSWKRIMIPDLFWIGGPWRGRLAIANRPRGGDWLKDELNGLRRAGVDVVVSLLETNEADQLDLVNEGRAAEANGIRFISFPIPDRGIPASMPSTISLMADVAGALEKGQNVAVHCRQGIGRSGLIAAGVLTIAGSSPADAIQAVSSARGLSIPETPDQRQWVEGLSPKPAHINR